MPTTAWESFVRIKTLGEKMGGNRGCLVAVVAMERPEKPHKAGIVRAMPSEVFAIVVGSAFAASVPIKIFPDKSPCLLALAMQRPAT
jgi:hypothetical protein